MNWKSWSVYLPALLLACSGSGSGDPTGGSATSGETTTTSGSGTADTSATSTSSGASTSGSASASGTSASTGSSATTSDSSSGTGATTSASGASSGTGVGTTGGACKELLCGNKLLECGNCIDDDNDGLVDGADPECVTPCDDDEGKFATGIPGDNMDPCKQDCFFDGNSGAGDDKCNWNLKCDPLSPGDPECPYDPRFKNCPTEQSPQCLDQCYTPNGCDCFGCCTVEYMGTSYDVFLGDPNCEINNIPDCSPCTKNVDCDNPCVPEDCEVCFGEVEPPEGCDDPSCREGVEACLVDADCADGFYCQTGCCFPLPG